jgi:hypothetical protein
MTTLKIQSLSIANGVLKVALYPDGDSGSLEAAIKDYIALHPECKGVGGCGLEIAICPSPGVCTLKFRGTMSDSDIKDRNRRRRVIINTKILERVASQEARQHGVKTNGLRVRLEKDNNGIPFLQVSGAVSALNGSASQGKQIISNVLKKYTGGLNINNTSLKERHAQR